MADTSQHTAAAERPARFVRLKIALGMIPEPSGRPSFIWLERWNTVIVGFAVAIGVPLLSLFVAYEDKKTILIWWLAIWLIFFFFFEGRELNGQMQGRGAIKQEQWSAQQRNAAQHPFWGFIFAIVAWFVVFAVHVAIKVYPAFDGSIVHLIFSVIPKQAWASLFDTPLYYGFVEWFIILQAWVGVNRVNYIMSDVGNTYSKAAPMGERTISRGEH